MKTTILEKIGEGVFITVGTIFLVALLLALDWAITVGIVYLIFKCFGWHFTLLIATGVWLIITFVGFIIKGNRERSDN